MKQDDKVKMVMKKLITFLFVFFIAFIFILLISCAAPAVQAKDEVSKTLAQTSEEPILPEFYSNPSEIGEPV